MADNVDALVRHETARLTWGHDTAPVDCGGAGFSTFRCAHGQTWMPDGMLVSSSVSCGHGTYLYGKFTAQSERQG